MHESTIAKSILDRISDRLESLKQPSRASRVYVRVGEFRNVDPDSLAFAFDCLKQDYQSCKLCNLQLDLVEARAICKDGRHEYRASPDNAYKCPECGSAIGVLLAGKELDITRITVNQNHKVVTTG